MLVSGNDLARRDQQHADTIAAAKRAGVAHLVYTSGLNAADSPSPIAASHAVTEDAVRASGIPFTILRNGWYTENYAATLPSVGASGVLLASVGDGTVASASRQDFAAAIAAVLTSDGHQGRTYELSGDVAWSYDDLAAALGEVLDRDVVHQPVTAEQHARVLTDAGLPEHIVQMAVAVDAGVSSGAFAYSNGDLSRLIGRPTTPLVEGLRAVA